MVCDLGDYICITFTFYNCELYNIELKTMQDREFEKLFNEKEGVNYFNSLTNPDAFKSLSEMMRPKNRNDENIKEANQIIEKNAIEMPQKQTSAIRHFIDQARKLKIKERTIRRMVKRKFGIMIVPNN